MLTVRFENLADAVDIYHVLGIDEKPVGANFVMYDEETPIALWRMLILTEGEPVGLIDKIFFADGVESGDKTFFMHAMFFKLMEGAPIRLRMLGEHRDLEKFGFSFVDGNMEANSNEINLHYGCGGRK